MLTTLEPTTDRSYLPAARLRSRAREMLQSTPYASLFVLLCALVLVPVALVVITALTDTEPRPGAALGHLTLANLREVFTSSNLSATWNSALMATSGTVLALVLGTGVAWLAARTNVPGLAFVQVVGIMPLFMPTLVGALAWTFLASPQAGYLNLIFTAAHLPFRVDIYSLGGMIFVFGLYYTPYTFLFMYGALSMMNPDLEQAATVHGASTARAARLITLPLMTPAMLGAALLTFVLILQNFPVPQILGTPGHVNTLPAFIFRLMNKYPQDANGAAAVGLLMILVMTAFILAQRWIVAAKEYRTVTGKGFRPRRIALGRWRWPAFAMVVAYAITAVVLPIAALVNVAFRSNSYVPDARHIVDPALMSLTHFHALFADERFALGLRNTLITSLGTAVLGGALHYLTSYAAYRTRRHGRAVLELLAMVPLAVPAIVLGLGIFWASLRFSLGIYGTLLIFVVAFTVQFMPQGFRSASSGMLQVHPELEEAARVSGASRGRTLGEVMLPLMRSSILSTMLLLFILSAGEVSAAIFLFTSQTIVTSVTLYGLWSDGFVAEAAALSLIFSGILLVIVVVARRWLGAAGEKV